MNSKNSNYRPVLVLAPGVLAGAEKVVLTGIVALSELGLNPLMIIIRETRAPHFAEDFKNYLPANIEQKTIDSANALDITLAFKLKKILRDEKLPIILHSHGFKALIACYFARENSPHLHTHHGNTSHTLKVRIYEKLAMITMKTCKHIFAVSIQMGEELKEQLHPYKNISVIENMLSLSNAVEVRQKRSLNQKDENDKINLIYVGRLSPEKGLLPFLECFASFRLKDKFYLTILGDGIERTLIENFITEHNLGNQIKLHGFVRDPSTYFIAPDVLIMPSLREGLPMTLIEALASGLPVIANNVGAISSLVVHQKNGYLSANNSKDSWNKVLEETLINYQNWKSNAHIQAKSLEERFSAKNWAEKTNAVFSQIINNS